MGILWCQSTFQQHQAHLAYNGLHLAPFSLSVSQPLHAHLKGCYFNKASNVALGGNLAPLLHLANYF